MKESRNYYFMKIKAFLFSLVYILCLVTVSMLGRGIIHSPKVLSIIIPLQGSINIISLSMALMIIMSSNGKYFKLSVLLQHLGLFSVIISIIFSKNISALPGLITNILGLLLSIRIYFYLRKLKLDEKLLDQITYIEPLTNTLNRRGLRNEIGIKINIGKPFFLVKLDIDNFKQINDSLGNQIGDNILKDFAERWLNINDNNYLLSRSGGDDFTFIYEGSNSEQLDKFLVKVYDVVKVINEKYNIDISITGGVSKYPNSSLDIDNILLYAEVAMKKAKKLNMSSYLYFELEDTENLIDKDITEDDIQKALYDGSFELLYQPQFDIASHKLVGVETLLRMKNKNGKYVNTQKLIDLAEQSGLIYEIDMWVLKNALMQTTDFIKVSPDIEISVNVSGKHIIKSEFFNYIIECLDTQNFNPINLKLEITESSYIKDVKEAINNINKLKSLGIKIALDDFGTGYSSLSYLAKIPVDLLKIDKSFVDNMELIDTKSKFINVIIKLGHLMGCKVIAEGVENEDQLKYLLEMKCDYVQGYVWGKPMSLEQVKNLK